MTLKRFLSVIVIFILVIAFAIAMGSITDRIVDDECGVAYEISGTKAKELLGEWCKNTKHIEYFYGYSDFDQLYTYDVLDVNAFELVSNKQWSIPNFVDFCVKELGYNKCLINPIGHVEINDKTVRVYLVDMSSDKEPTGYNLEGVFHKTKAVFMFYSPYPKGEST